MGETLAAAIDYTERGWIVHRVHPPTATVNSPGKQPVDARWQKVTTPPTEAKLTEWFGQKAYNIGLLCGEASGVTVIDLDRMLYADIFNGVETLRSSRTSGRGHIYFKYNPRLAASKHHNLGIEVLSTGNNAILAPSVHASGDLYRWDDPAAPLAEMAPEIETKLKNLFKREKDLMGLVAKCRPCFKRLFKKEIREATDFHGAEGRELMLAWGADLQAAGATLADGEMWAKIVYGDGYDPTKTLTEWRNIDPAKTWKCSTIADKFGGVIKCDCEGCSWKAPTAPAQPAKIIENAVGDDFDLYTMVERMIAKHPICYDRTRNYWVWSEETKSYRLVDKTDILIAVKNATGTKKGVITPAKNMFLQAVEIIGRENQPKEVPKEWIQFRDHVVDINTGKEFDATCEHFWVNPIPHNYGDSEDTPTIDALFDSWLGDRSEVLYEIIAYSLYRGYPIHRIFALFGSGRNGKGQFMDILGRFMGEGCTCSTTLELIAESRFEAAKLHKKNVAFIGETNFNTLKNTAQLKRLSGEDKIPGEFKQKTPFDFVNHAKVVIATNSIPITYDKSRGFHARWIIIEFPNEFDEGVPVVDTIPEWEYENLGKKCIRILRELLKRGKFTGEGSISDRAQKYEEASNPISKFIKTYCKVGGDLEVALWEFYEAYDAWQGGERHRRLTKKVVSGWLRDNGYDVEQHKRKNDSGEWKAWQIVFGLTMVGCQANMIDRYGGDSDSHELATKYEPLCGGANGGHGGDGVHFPLDILLKEKRVGSTPPSPPWPPKLCGQCGKPLTGDTFHGPVGLGTICATCQAELNPATGRGTVTDEQITLMTRSAIYKLGYVRGLHEFTAVEALMEFPKGTGITTETIEAYLIDHAADLKIERTDGGTWRQVI